MGFSLRISLRDGQGTLEGEASRVDTAGVRLVANRSPHALVDGGTKAGANEVVPPDADEEWPDDSITNLERRDPTARPAPVDPDPTIPKPERGR